MGNGPGETYWIWLLSLYLYLYHKIGVTMTDCTNYIVSYYRNFFAEGYR